MWRWFWGDRLNDCLIEIPPLKERPEDIELILAHYFDKYRNELNKKIDSFSSTAFDALKEYNTIFDKISETNKNDQQPFQNGKILNCETANNRFISLQRKDQNNFQNNNSLIDFCQLAEASLTIWTEIENIVTQCPDIDESGSESQFAKESIYWATETKLRTCN